MPRASYVGSKSFREGKQDHSPENVNFDFCYRCWWMLSIESFTEDFVVPDAKGPIDERFVSFEQSEGDDHPDYEGEDYHCCNCRKPLKAKDN